MLSRRKFLKMSAVAGLLPALPRLPFGGGPGAASRSLWAGIYAKSGGSAAFTRVAGGFGVSPQAAQGVLARQVFGAGLAAVGAKTGGEVASSAGPRAAVPAGSPEPVVPGKTGRLSREVKELLADGDSTDEVTVRDDLEAGPEADLDVGKRD